MKKSILILCVFICIVSCKNKKPALHKKAAPTWVKPKAFGYHFEKTKSWLATTSVPNMVRGSVPIMLIRFDYLKHTNSVIYSVAFVGLIAFTLAIYATLTIKETHQIDLDYVE